MIAKFLGAVGAVAVIMAIFLIPQNKAVIEHSVFINDRSNISKIMEQDGSFSNVTLFKIIEKIPSLQKYIQAGEYTLTTGDNIFEFLARITSGKVVIRKLTIPEGWTSKRIVEFINANELLKGELTEIPNEGSLMPDTYFYKYLDSKSSIITKMRQEMDKFLGNVMKTNKTDLSTKDVLILASIVEKESHIKDERPLVASVYINRLKKNMRLQSDPTVIYGMSDGYGKIDNLLTHADLWHESPYNTYRNKGLPPSPICAPSRNAIMAVLNYTPSNYLFFIADADNARHIFSEDFDRHRKIKRNIKRTPKTF